MVVDGQWQKGTEIDMHGTLSDVRFPPGADALPLQEELEEGFESEVELTVSLPSMVAEKSSGRLR